MAIITPPDLHQCAFLLHDLAYNARKFLDAASSVDDLNARRIFVELTRMPSPRTIRRYAGNELLRRWSSENPDPQINGGAISFYRVDRGMCLYLNILNAASQSLISDRIRPRWYVKYSKDWLY